MSDYIEAQGSKEERRDLLKFHLGTATFGSEDEVAVRELLADLEAAQASIAILRAALRAANAELRTDAERMSKEDLRELYDRAHARTVINSGDAINLIKRIAALTAEVDALKAALASTAPVAACSNCGHANPHNSPAGEIADACNEATCNCGYYTPVAAQKEGEQ